MAERQEDIYLGVDYGERNTGLAFGRVGLVSPFKVLDSKNQDSLVSEMARVVATEKISKVVMGLPTDVEGRDTAQSLKIRQFAKVLRIKLKRPVEFVSEYGTSEEALSSQIRAGVSRKGRRTNDHYSAALILKRFFREMEEN